MNNFVHISQFHNDLFNIFIETSGITFITPTLIKNSNLIKEGAVLV